MKRIKTSLIFIVTAALMLGSCGKNVNGCMDSTASNYNSSATKDDGTCKYTGNLMFWTDRLSVHGGTMTITLDNNQTATITTNYSSPQQCVATVGGAMLGVSTGAHTYTTKDYFGQTSTGTVTVATGGCIAVYLK